MPAEIVASAGRLFALRGYAATSLDEVAAELGITRAGVLYHFGSKTAILDAAVEPVLARLEALAAAAPAAPLTTVHERRLLIADFTDAVLAEPNAATIAFGDWGLAEEVAARVKAFLDRFATLLSGSHSSGDGRLLASAVVGSVLGPLRALDLDGSDPARRASILAGAYAVGAPAGPGRRSRRLRGGEGGQGRHDALTGMASREAFCVAVDDERHSDADEALTVVLVGLDDFKDVNSAFGYSCGDALLVAVGRRLAGASVAAPCLARVSGDVFALLVTGRTGGGVAATAAMTAAVRSLFVEPFFVQGMPVQLSATVGLACADDLHISGEQLVRRAELALFRAKRAGDASAVFDRRVDEPTAGRLVRVTELRNALARGELDVHYQPVVNMRTGTVASVEALVRWHSPDYGMVLPGEFISLAEQSGLIDELTHFVVRTAGEQVRAWARAGRPLRCAINVSPRCLADPDVSEWLITELGALDGMLTVEVTESIFAERRAVAALRRLQAAGVQCAIDDFGTGFSSLASLRALPVSTLKIDRAFLADIGIDHRALAVIESIVSLADALGLDVIAEGIECESTAALLQQVGVVGAQGFWFARPMAADDLELWIEEQERAASLAPLTLLPERVGVAPAAGSGQTAATFDGASDPDGAAAIAAALPIVLEAARDLLRVESVEQAVGILIRSVTALGGDTVPDRRLGAGVIPIDIGLGHAGTRFARAYPGSPARSALDRVLPRLVEDAWAACARLDVPSTSGADSLVDPLTGVGTRRSLARMRALVDTDALAVVDLDRLRAFNQSVGREAGDQVLVAFSRTLRQHLRASDQVFRLGGAEFLLVMPSTTVKGVRVALGHLRERWLAERPADISFSAGVAPVEDGDLSTAILQADGALRRAKADGPDQIGDALSFAGGSGAVGLAELEREWRQ